MKGRRLVLHPCLRDRDYQYETGTQMNPIYTININHKKNRSKAFNFNLTIASSQVEKDHQL